jgi:hypothetical protein
MSDRTCPPPVRLHRAHASAEAQIVFRHFARVLARLVPPARTVGRNEPQRNASATAR